MSSLESIIAKNNPSVVNQQRLAQQFDYLDKLEKGKALPVGTIKTRGSNKYIKTAAGWKYHSRANSNKEANNNAPAEKKKKAPKVTTNIMNKPFKQLSKKDLINSFPVSTYHAERLIKKVLGEKGRDFDLKGTGGTEVDQFDSFAITRKTITFTLNDTGLSSVTPGGTYHAKRGVAVELHLRTYFSDEGERRATFNASYNTPGGMSILKTMNTTLDPTDSDTAMKDLGSYIKAVANYLKPNKVKDDLY